jgi:putative NADPH-quinone reductase
MTVTVVVAHPWDGSYNRALYDTAVRALEARGREVVTIDLNIDGFDPVMKQADLALFSKGKSTDEQVEKYQAILKNTKELVFIFPLWWFGPPAILKGFMDKVMLKNFAYTESKLGLKGLLTHIKKATVITTSESPTFYLRVKGNPIKNIFINAALREFGIKKIVWLNHGRTKSGSEKSRRAFLRKVEKHFSA